MTFTFYKRQKDLTDKPYGKITKTPRGAYSYYSSLNKANVDCMVVEHDDGRRQVIVGHCSIIKYFEES